jgi:chemotaxis protein MotB
VTQVRGYADMMLRVKNNPYDPSNRRISILVKNMTSGSPQIADAETVGVTGAAAGDKASRTDKPAVPARAPAAEKPSVPPAAAQPAKTGLMDKLTGKK